MFVLGVYNSTGGIQLSFLGVYNSTEGIQLSFQGVYNSTGGIQISFLGVYNSTGGIQLSFLSGFLWFFTIFYSFFDIDGYYIVRTNEGQPRPKYIFNKCGTNIYFFTLQRFGPSPSPNFKSVLLFHSLMGPTV